MKIAINALLVLVACSSSAPRGATPSSTRRSQDPWLAEPDASALDATETEREFNGESSQPPVVPARPTPPRPPSTQAGSSEDPSGIVAAHNVRRARHCAAPLRWSAEVAVVAQRWANGLAARGCAMQHSS
ncbi:MAG: hypothetical protein KBG15_17340, partial [Kofleriaceae bacterium]|nr:hypothetical protein [Kofleriaceae bacterium]